MGGSLWITGEERIGLRAARKGTLNDRQGKLIAQVGTISANNDEASGNIIAEAMEKMGKDGVITIEEAESMEMSLEVGEGAAPDQGFNALTES